MTKLMVVGGVTDEGNLTNYVEALDMNPYGQAETCQDPREYPAADNHLDPVGAFFGGKPIVCGGREGSGSTGDCFEYEVSRGIWLGTNGLLTPRRGASATIIDSTQWWITGGADNDGTLLDTTEIRSTQLFDSYGPLMPEGNAYHCFVKVDADRYILIGGEAGDSVYLYDTQEANPKFHRKASFPGAARDLESCGIATNNNGQRFVIVVGGWWNDDTWRDVWSYSPDNNSWFRINDFPYPVYRASAVPFGNSFLIVGGYNSYTDSAYDEIWQFEPNTLTWINTNQRLKLARAPGSGSFFVPDSQVVCA